MDSADVTLVWTRMLSVAAGARAAAGAPGPLTRIRGRTASQWLSGPWLGLIDFDGLDRAEREVLAAWLFAHAEPLLLVRHVLLAQPLQKDVFVELTAQAQQAMPVGWREEPRPILLLAPAGRIRPDRRREWLAALAELRIPLLARGSELWGIREYDAAFLVALARLSDPQARAAFRAAIDPSQRRLFDQQLAVVQAAVLDDLVGGRDDDDAVALDVEALSSLHPQAHPLAVFSAVERAHNRRRSAAERTQFAGRTAETRLSARGFPETIHPCTAEFAARAAAIAPFLDSELQRIFEASELLAQP